MEQILFFRHLGFKLNDISKILTSNEFDKIEALTLHRFKLKHLRVKNRYLIEEIDKAIIHLKSHEPIPYEKQHQIFCKDLNEKMITIECQGLIAEEILINALKNPIEKDSSQWNKNRSLAQETINNLILCINKGFAPKDREVHQ